MAYPDYSIVIVSVTQGGVTTDYANAFYNDELAKKFYDKAVTDGKRAFYFERPQPSKFTRNDAQPLKINTEKGLEGSAVQSIDSGDEQSAGELIEELKLNIQHEIEDAYKTTVTISKIGVKVATKYWDTFYVGPFKFFKKVLNRLEYEAINSIESQTQITNKRLTIKHNGIGGFTFEVEKLWPDKGEKLFEIPEPKTQEIPEAGEVVVLGTGRKVWTYDGDSELDRTYVWENNWLPVGTQVLDTDYKTYYSDGDGFYYSIPKTSPNPNPEDPNPPPNPCPSAGQEFSREFFQDLMYPIVTDTGLEEVVQVGIQYNVVTIGSDCGYESSIVSNYSPSGTVVYESDTTWWKSDGNGAVYTQAKPTEEPPPPDGEDNGGGYTNPPCLQEGEFIRREVVDTATGLQNWQFETESGTYQAYIVMRNVYADGYCGENYEDEENEYIEEGLVLASIDSGTSRYLVITGSNGNYYIQAAYDNSEGPYEPNQEFPYSEAGDQPITPCADVGYGAPTDISRFRKNKSGNIEGTKTERKIKVPLGLSQDGKPVLHNSQNKNQFIEFKTGMQWTGRWISAQTLGDQPCQFTKEIENVKETWQIPNECIKAGYYKNNYQTQDSPSLWVLTYLDKIQNNSPQYKPFRCYFVHDGLGGIVMQGGV